MPIEIQVEINAPPEAGDNLPLAIEGDDDETEVTLEEDITPISVTDVIDTIIEEATDTQINVNSGQSKEDGFLKR